MLLKAYSLKIFKSKCQADALGDHCFANLDQDVTQALPYLNTMLGRFEYLNAPPAVTFKTHGKLITVHGNKIAVNALMTVRPLMRISTGALPTIWAGSTWNCKPRSQTP